MAEHVDAIGRDLEVEDGVPVGVELVDGCAEGGVLINDHDAFVILADL